MFILIDIAYRTSRPQILDLRFARYAKYDNYYTIAKWAENAKGFARYAKYDNYYTKEHSLRVGEWVC